MNNLVGIFYQDGSDATVAEMTFAMGTSISQIPVVVEMGYSIGVSYPIIPVVVEMIYQMAVGDPNTNIQNTLLNQITGFSNQIPSITNSIFNPVL